MSGELDRIRRLLTDERIWERPSPAVLDTIIERITQVARSDPLGFGRACSGPPPAAPPSGHPEGSGDSEAG